jgi:hypothetical protein
MNYTDQYNVIWDKQSKNSSESMPVSGCDIGLNTWVENNELLIYINRAGYRDENGALLKPGRLRINFSPNPFSDGSFTQKLNLNEGCVEISSKNKAVLELNIKIWIEIQRPIVHIDCKTNIEITGIVKYENWRYEDIELPNDKSKFERRSMCMLNYDACPETVTLYKDKITHNDKHILFKHIVDNTKDCFDYQIKQQGLSDIADTLKNPLENLIWGGALNADEYSYIGTSQGAYSECPYKAWQLQSNHALKNHRIRVCLHHDQTQDENEWENDLNTLVDLDQKHDQQAWNENLKWWKSFWNRSHLVINDQEGEANLGWRIARNYQLFRYMLACNLKGNEPTLFNGGLFNFDPEFVNGKKGDGYTPDHRQWGSGLTAQNQRLLVWPLLKTGDFDLARTGFEFYPNNLNNTTKRVKQYWGHEGCCFTEQISITGLPGSAVYGFESGKRKRSGNAEIGYETNDAVSRLNDSQLEYAWLILRWSQFSGENISPYLNFIEQAVIFYDQHFRMQNKKRTGSELGSDNKLVIYPSNALEYHPGSKNPSSVVAGLRRILSEMIFLKDYSNKPELLNKWKGILKTIPKLPTGENPKFGGTYVKPSENHEHQSSHNPEMYALYPYEWYGDGYPDLNLMENTFKSIAEDRFLSDSWIQSNIHSARLKDTHLAQKLTSEKMDNGPYRFPAFWPETIDWAPDHNWGGCGMIGLQEMLLQTHSRPGEEPKYRLYNAWPKEWDVKFKLHAPNKTIITSEYKKGHVLKTSVSPGIHEKQLLSSF